MGDKEAQPQRRDDFDGVVRRSLDVTVRGVDEEARSVDVVASTTAIDAHGDILEQDWRLERYRKNPVVLWHHNRFESSPWSMGEGIRPEDLLPIGHAKDVRVEDGMLQARLVFGSSAYNAMSERVFLGFKEGHIRAVSVGFRPGKITEEKVDGGTIFRLSENDLMEISAVPIPSNPEAVAKHIAWERAGLAAVLAARSAPRGKEIETMMTPEERKALETAQEEARSAKDRATQLEKSLADEKTVSAKLGADLKAAGERAEAAEAQLATSEIDKLVGVKFYPAEREEQLALVKSIGLDRVKAMAEKRPNIKLTEPVKVGGEPVTKTGEAPATETADDETDGSTELRDAALKQAKSAA